MEIHKQILKTERDPYARCGKFVHDRRALQRSWAWFSSSRPADDDRDTCQPSINDREGHTTQAFSPVATWRPKQACWCEQARFWRGLSSYIVDLSGSFRPPSLW